MTTPRRILYCHCTHADVVPEATRRRVLERLAEAGVEFTPVPDLCGLAARGDPKVVELAADESLAVAACHPRAVRWLFDAAGAPLPESACIVNMRTTSGDDVADALLEGVEPDPEACGCGAEVVAAAMERTEPDAWIPWFPVIDRDRCTGCRQCLNFCLFGAFGVDGDGRVTVAHPEKCKTNCPACARVCPEAAIVFPKYPSGPVSGADPDAAGEADEPVRVNMEDLVQGDVHAMLRRRSGAEPVDEETRNRERAEAERMQCSCMDRLAEKLGVDRDVLASAAEDLQGGPTENPAGGDA